jgi:hypothetical protein
MAPGRSASEILHHCRRSWAELAFRVADVPAGWIFPESKKLLALIGSERAENFIERGLYTSLRFAIRGERSDTFTEPVDRNRRDIERI